MESASAEASRLRNSSFVQSDPRAFSDVGRADLASGRFDDSARSLRRFLEWNPYSPEEWKLLASAEQGAGHANDTREAIHNIELARKNTARRLHQMALRAEIVGSKPAALAYIRQAVAVDPADDSARKDLARLSLPETPDSP